MTILRSGSTKKYSDNWAKAFGSSKKKATKQAKKSTKKKVSKKAKSSKK